MCKEIGVIGTGIHKKMAIAAMVNPEDATFKMLKIDGVITEIEHQNPKKVLRPKLVDYLGILSPTLQFLADNKLAPQAVMAMDVLGLDMSGAEHTRAAFGQSCGILKKPENVNPEKAIAEACTSHKINVHPIGGYVYDAFVS